LSLGGVAQAAYEPQQQLVVLNEPELLVPAGMAELPDGGYLVSGYMGRISRLSADGDFISWWGRTGRDPDYLKGPTAMAPAPDGTVYILSGARLEHFTLDGRPLGHFHAGTPGAGEATIPTDVAIDGEGDIYVVDSIADRVTKFNPGGGVVGGWGETGSGPGQWTNPFAIDVAPDGSVVVAEDGRNKVMRFTQEGQLSDEWGESRGTGYMSGPSAIDVAPNGDVIVGDAGREALLRYTADGAFLGAYAEGEVWGPRAIDAGSADITVVERAGYRVQRYSNDGERIWAFGRLAYFPDDWINVSDVGLDDDGNVYVSGPVLPKIGVFSPDGTPLRKIGTRGSGPGEIYQPPSSIEVAGDGTVVAREREVIVFNPAGEPIHEWEPKPGFTDFALADDGTIYTLGQAGIEHVTLRGQRLGRLVPLGATDRSYSIAVGPTGDIFVGGDGGAWIRRYAPDGELLAEWDTTTQGPEGSTPWRRIAVDSDNAVHVSPQGLPGIRKYSEDGALLETIGLPSEGYEGMLSPRSIAVSGPNLVVGDYDRAVVDGFTDPDRARESSPPIVSPPADPAVVTIEPLTIPESDGPARVRLRLDRPVAGTVTVRTRSLGGSAVSGADFEPVSDTATFPPGSQSATVEVVVKDDEEHEGDERVAVELYGVTGGAVLGEPVWEYLTIEEDDPEPVLTVQDAVIGEGDGSVEVPIMLDRPADEQIRATVQTRQGSALRDHDYTTTGERVVIPPHQTTASIEVPIVDDAISEGNESFLVEARIDEGPGSAAAPGTVVISDDDAPPPPPSAVTVGDASVTEGTIAGSTMNFPVTLSEPASETVSVSLVSLDLEATSPADYASTSETVTFDQGEDSAVVSVAVAGDASDETDERFALGISAVSGATIAKQWGVGTILDDDDTLPPGPPNPADPVEPGPNPPPRATPCVLAHSGTKAADRLLGSDAGDRMAAGAGADRLFGLGGDDCLLGGRGKDRLDGGGGHDRLTGGPGNDLIRARDGEADVVNCGRGADRLIGDPVDRAVSC
jgi:hypothetical protein